MASSTRMGGKNGMDPEDAKVIRRQLGWTLGLLAVAGLAVALWAWGQDSGWGNPDRAVANHMAKGEAAFVAGHLDEAVKHYARIVQKYPQHPMAVQAQTQLATAYQQEGRLADALAVLQRLSDSLKDAQDKPDLKAYTLLEIGKVKADLLDYAGAQAAYQAVRQGFPKTDWSGEAQSGLGQILQAQRHFDDARGAYQVLVKELPGGFLAAEAQTSIGACYEAQANTKAALKAYQLVLDKYPSAVWDTAKSRVDALKKELDTKSGKTSKRG